MPDHKPRKRATSHYYLKSSLMFITPHLRANVSDGGAPFPESMTVAPHVRLCLAIDNGDLQAVSDIMGQCGPDVLAEHVDGHTALHRALSLGQDAIAMQMLDKLPEGHAALNMRDRQGYTPLMLAVQNSSIPLSKMLIGKGATVYAGDDAHCSEAVVTQKKEILAAAALLLETRGDVAAANLLAIQRDRNHPYSRQFGRVHGDLVWKARLGEMEAGRAMVEAGVDPSHALMIAMWSVAEVTAAHRHVAKNLIALGADPTSALRQALANPSLTVLCKMCTPALLLLGAAGERVLTTASAELNAQAVEWLMRHSVRAENALAHHAKSGNAQAVRLLLDSAPKHVPIDAARVLCDLAKSGHRQAVELLITEGVQAAASFKQLIDKGDKAAVKVFIEAGIDTSETLREFASKDRLYAPGGFKRLSFLIGAGADPSRLLYESIKNGSGLALPALLMAAAAMVPPALDHASPDERRNLERALMEAKNLIPVLPAKEQGHDAMDLLVDIVGARDDMASPESDALRARLQTLAATYQARGEQRRADLVRALEQVNWEGIKALAEDAEASKDVMAELSHHGSIRLGSLLAAAGVDAREVLALALRDHWQGRAATTRLSFLLDVGYDPSEVVAALLEANEDDLAKALVQEKGIDPYGVLDTLHKQHKLDELEQFLLRVTPDKGIACIERAIHEGRNDLAYMFIDSGASRPDFQELVEEAAEQHDAVALKTLANMGVFPRPTFLDEQLCRAVEGGSAFGADQLMRLGASPSRALIIAIKHYRPPVAGTLLSMGADTSALTHYMRNLNVDESEMTRDAYRRLLS